MALLDWVGVDDGRVLLGCAAEEDDTGLGDGVGSATLEGVSAEEKAVKEDELPSEDGVKSAEEEVFVGVPQPANKNKTKPKVNRLFILCPSRESIHYR